MQIWVCQLASVRAVGEDKNTRLSTDAVQSDVTEKKSPHSCLTMTTSGTLGLERQTSSQHQIDVLILIFIA